MKIYIIPFLSFFALMLAGGSTFAREAPSFEGEWSGKITQFKKKAKVVHIRIEDGSFVQSFKTEDGWEPVQPTASYYKQVGDIATLGWLKEGGFWTESQMFSLSYINPDELLLVWTRHVTNRKPGEEGDPWEARGEAVLTRVQ